LLTNQAASQSDTTRQRRKATGCEASARNDAPQAQMRKLQGLCPRSGGGLGAEPPLKLGGITSMNEAEKRSNFLGLIVLFVVYTVLGSILSFFYVLFQTRVHDDVWFNIIAAFVVAAVLAVVVWLLKYLFKITNNAMAFLLVLIGTVVILYVMWSMWLLLMFELLYLTGEVRKVGEIGAVFSATWSMMRDNPEFFRFLQYFNYNGVWSINDNVWSGPMLWAVWAGETLIIASIPLIAAYASAGLFINELGAWVEVRLLNYGFTAFDDYELDSIGGGDINTIIQKSLENRNAPMHAVGVCYLKGEPTEFIALYKAHWDKEGALAKSGHVMTVQLGAEKIDALDAGLQARHYPTQPPQVQPAPGISMDDSNPFPEETPEETEWNNDEYEPISSDIDDDMMDE